MRNLALSAALCLLPAGTLLAQDHMGMVELYGQGVVNSLGNQIRSAGIRSSMGTGGGSAPAAPAARWPAHITAASVGGHVFTVDELRAMRGADAARMGQMLEGRTIRISGTVVYPPRAGSSIQLVGSQGPGFHVFASFPGGRGMPRAGARVTLQGTVDRVRRTVMSVKQPRVTGSGATAPAAAQAAGPAGAGPSRGSAPDYQALRFRSTAAVTRSLADQFAQTLAPALKAGRSPQEIADLVRGGRLQGAFRQLLQPYGFSDHDVADVLASHMVMIWQVANDQTSPSPRAHVIAVRDQTREALARADWVRAMDDADKQRLAETLSVGTMMVVGRYVHGHETRDRATIDMAIGDARALARSFANIDMTRYALTDQGLAPRRR